jgi:hypothetical protein
VARRVNNGALRQSSARIKLAIAFLALAANIWRAESIVCASLLIFINRDLLDRRQNAFDKASWSHPRRAKPSPRGCRADGCPCGAVKATAARA